VESADLVALMQGHGVKPTSNRLLVARALADSPRPVSLPELEGMLLTVDKSNISRALALFRDSHLVHVIEDGSQGTRYELCMSPDAEEDEDMHVHFFCERCRRTYCLHEVQVPPVPVPEGFRAHTVNYVVKGICPACSR